MEQVQGKRSAYSPTPCALKAMSHCVQVSVLKKMHGHTEVAISVPQGKLALQSHLLSGEPLKRWFSTCGSHDPFTGVA